MGKKKLTMYFLVEGETEKWYLEWLAEQVTAASPSFWANFRIGTRIAPASFAKRMRPPNGSRVYTLLDFESTDPIHERHFLSLLKQMHQCSRTRDLDFVLGYTNYSFELWLILHKAAFTRPVYHRKDYLPVINEVYGTSFRSMPNYKKERNFRSLLRKLSLDDVRAAIARSEEIRLRNEREGCTLLTYQGYKYYRHDPSLSIDRVVKAVLEEAEVPID